MIGPDELLEYVQCFRAAGIGGRVKVGDIEFTLPLDVVQEEPKPLAKDMPPLKSKAVDDRWLFACTEGIPEEEDK